MKYDVLLTGIGKDELSVSFAVMNTIQKLAPIPVADVSAVKHWFSHLPLLLRRGASVEDARQMQQHYENLGASVSLIPTRLYFPTDNPDISSWQNEWFSEHLIALHENNFVDWAQEHSIREAYRFSFFPSYGMDIAIRLWISDGDELQASARRSIGRIGPLPGPPREDSLWSPMREDWEQLLAALQQHAFWESESWDTVPEGFIVLDQDHWVLEGWKASRYHVLCDQTPNEGALHAIGLLLIDLLPDHFIKPAVK